MLRDRIWRKHLLFLLLAAGAALAGGQLAGYPAEALLVVLLAYLLWVESNLYRLFIWLKQGKRRKIHESGSSIWHELYTSVLRLEKRNKKRKQRFDRLLTGFRDSMSALPDATVVLSETGEVEWWNRMARDLLGFTRDHPGPRQIEEFIEDPGFCRYLEAGDYHEPLEIPSPVDRDILLSVRIVPYSKGKRLLQARNITLMRQLENVRREFVANASHELRTPLTVVHGYLETMVDDPELHAGPWQRALTQMYQQSNRVKGIVEDMLALSQLEQGRHGDVQGSVEIPLMLKIIKEEAELLSGAEGHKIELELQSDCNLVGSTERLHSLFANLVSNAVRYTPAGGRITIAWCADETGARFSVMDTGIGIEPHHIARLTERFYRVDAARSREIGGTGLGLAIVKHILNLMDGQLSIESKPGVGSTFTCHFPPELVKAKAVESPLEDVIQPLHNSNLSVTEIT
ncbi:MAG: phosphate regulon sensor histidine kinase PhoR [Gammaproteobacteria bacterium]|jgi:two-component system phosphate regulon sensor histidine kinase PhoR